MRAFRSDKTENQNFAESVVANQQERTEYTPGIEFKILTAVIFLSAFGLIMIFSASSYSASLSIDTNYDSTYYFKKQLFITIGAMVVLAIVNVVPYKVFKKLEWVVYLASIGVLLLLRTPLGKTVNGATRWIVIAGFQVQVADIVKLCMIIFMAAFISNNWKNIHKAGTIILLWVLVGIQAGIVLVISSNLSSAIILMLMCFTITFIVSGNNKLHTIVLILGIVGVAIFIFMVKNNLPLESELDNYPYQMRRFFAWLAPEKYAGGIGYQVLQSLYAIGSGGLLGKGLGNGTQKLVNIPEAQNDMIFAIICEELGLVGALLMFLMFGYLLFQMFVVIRESRNLYGSLVVMGVMLHIGYQIIVNVCVAVNVFPNTGVSLPFISYGGSAILFTLIEIGLVIGIRRQQVNKRYSRIN
ncbi:MAG: FtsW/RodA/SpoVE family cell cycle protein [Coprococcus sp.]